MFIDQLGVVSDGQAVVGSTVSTNAIDTGAQSRDVGRGEPVGFTVNIVVALSATSLAIEAIEATDAALTTGINVVSRVHGLAADFPAGALHFVELPPGIAKRFLGLRYVPTGGAGTVTVKAWYGPKSLFEGQRRVYPENVVR